MVEAGEPSVSGIPGMREDTSSNLCDVRDRCTNGLVPQLLKMQEHQVVEEKCHEWARDPLCLSIISQQPSRKRKRGAHSTQVSTIPKPLHRVLRSQAHNGDYVAVSYTSEPSEHESDAAKEYRIMGSAQGNFDTPTRVRDCVLHRTIKYAEHHGAELIWIDDECINRDNPDEHEMAMQSMDLIYKLSKHPVGLLSNPITSHEDLNLLQGLLKSDFIKTSRARPMLKPEVSVQTALKILSLLDYITTDKWWTRAWIFQENYRSSIKMNLLVPHSLLLNRTQARREWCSIPSELQVSSVDFHEQATLFCLAFCQKAGEEWQGAHRKCEDILSRARKYNLLYQHGHFAGQELARKAMSPSIFTDIGNRHISQASDFLAIAANCCDYSIRLNTKKLKKTSCSLSISILALYLLNGEIIKNDENDESLLSENIFSYLRQIAFDRFDPPVESKELTFIKSCRLVDVRLSPDGIVTSGRLWRLHKAIDTGKFTSKLRPERRSPNGLNQFQRSRLRQLSEELRKQRYRTVADNLDDYLHEDAEYPPSSAKQYMDLMAEEVVEAIRNRKTIHLGCQVGCNSCRGVFVTNSALETPSYVFTAWGPARSRRKALGVTRVGMLLKKHVSLEVEATNLEDLPRLKTKRWMNGLCFFDRDPARDVIFPYPKSLTG